MNIYLASKKSQQSKFFDELAKSKNFDPLDAEKWYSLGRKDIKRALCLSNYCTSLFSHFILQAKTIILKYYDNSRVKALIKLYPELNLKKENFAKSKIIYCSRSLIHPL
jgi:hypothetical protein